MGWLTCRNLEANNGSLDCLSGLCLDGGTGHDNVLSAKWLEFNIPRIQSLDTLA